MPEVATAPNREGLPFMRFMMVLGSMAPVFILWAIRGTKVEMPPGLFLGFCVLMVTVPNLLLLARLIIARRYGEKRELVVGSAEDHRDHILVYLFASLLPFYSEDIDSWRFLISSLVALAFIVFLFWHLNLHYMNIFFALGGFRVFTVYSDGTNEYSGKRGSVVLTRRTVLAKNDRLDVYILSDTVFLEVG